MEKNFDPIKINFKPTERIPTSKTSGRLVAVVTTVIKTVAIELAGNAAMILAQEIWAGETV